MAASSSAASSSAFQPTEQVSASPLDLTAFQSEAQHQENKAWRLLYKASEQTKEHQANVEESQLAARLRTVYKKTDFFQHDEDSSSDSEMPSRGLESDGRANPSAMSGTSRPKFDNGALIFGLGDGTDLRIENPAMLQDEARRAKHTTTPQVATAATEADSAAPKLGTHEDKVDIEARLMLEFAIGNPTASYKCMKTATHLIMQSMSDCTSPHKP
jgi:hypothetical protein